MFHSTTPQANGEHPTAVVTMTNLLAAAELVDDVARCSEQATEAFTESARIFFEHGVEVGRKQAEEEMAARWADVTARIVRPDEVADQAVRDAEALSRWRDRKHFADYMSRNADDKVIRRLLAEHEERLNRQRRQAADRQRQPDRVPRGGGSTQRERPYDRH